MLITYENRKQSYPTYVRTAPSISRWVHTHNYGDTTPSPCASAEDDQAARSVEHLGRHTTEGAVHHKMCEYVERKDDEWDHY
mmetsp:Transcript_69058/g.136903  ORF Transcript_69058/g.136903 Transcript_69058/m.136903 type:complete len:82 (+) Transcript_69058:138-383(+)